MKLAEALMERENLENDINALNEKLVEEAIIDKDYEVLEDLNIEFKNHIEQYDKYEEIVNKINEANARVYEGVTNLELLNKRNVLTKKYNNIRQIYLASKKPLKQETYGDKIIEKKLNIDRMMIKKELNKICKEARELEVKIQSRNWTMEI